MKEQYQGKRLGYLLLALCLPAGLLYVRLVFGLAATDSRLDASQTLLFGRLSLVALVTFFVAQAVCALYVQRLFPVKRSAAAKALQYAGALVFGVLFSLAGAITLEAFGFATFLRAAGAR